MNMNEVTVALTELLDDSTIPRNVKIRVQNTISLLQQQNDSLAFNKAMHELEEAVDDVNIQAYTRTQILNVVSLLEMFDSK